MRGSEPGERRGGRQRGTPNKRTAAREQAQTEVSLRITKALGADAFEGDAHALLVAIYKDPAQPIDVRLDAAKTAIGFEKPRLAALKADVNGGLTLEQLVLGSYKAEAKRPMP
jgi:hypothetical protein